MSEWRVTFRDAAFPFGMIKSSGNEYSANCKKQCMFNVNNLQLKGLLILCN